MDTSEFDQRIEAAEKRLTAIRDEMATARDALAAAVAEYASGWYERAVKSAIDRNPERAKELGLDGVRALKSDLADLQNEAVNIVQTRFIERVPWAHEQDEPQGLKDEWSNPYEPRSNRRVPSVYEEPLRRVLGAVQPLLAENGLSEDRYPPGARDGDRYAYGLDWPTELQASGSRYAELFGEFKEVWKARSDAEKAKAQAEAEDLWNRA